MSEPTAPKKTTKKPSATSKTGIKKPRAKATGATRVKPKTKPTPKSNEVPHPNKKVVLVLSLFFNYANDGSLGILEFTTSVRFGR